MQVLNTGPNVLSLTSAEKKKKESRPRRSCSDRELRFDGAMF